MQRQMLKSKIHRATVTGCDVDYVGSVTVDRELLDSADILVNELVHVWDISNGSRFVTYAIEGERGAGDIQINGAAALLVNEGDMVIVASYANYDEADLETYAPVVVHVDARQPGDAGRLPPRDPARPRPLGRGRDPRRPRRRRGLRRHRPLRRQPRLNAATQRSTDDEQRPTSTEHAARRSHADDPAAAARR